VCQPVPALIHPAQRFDQSLDCGYQPMYWKYVTTLTMVLAGMWELKFVEWWFGAVCQPVPALIQLAYIFGQPLGGDYQPMYWKY
jgi:hypothetical protein